MFEAAIPNPAAVVLFHYQIGGDTHELASSLQIQVWAHNVEARQKLIGLPLNDQKVALWTRR